MKAPGLSWTTSIFLSLFPHDFPSLLSSPELLSPLLTPYFSFPYFPAFLVSWRLHFCSSSASSPLTFFCAFILKSNKKNSHFTCFLTSCPLLFPSLSLSPFLFLSACLLSSSPCLLTCPVLSPSCLSAGVVSCLTRLDVLTSPFLSFCRVTCLHLTSSSLCRLPAPSDNSFLTFLTFVYLLFLLLLPPHLVSSLNSFFSSSSFYASFCLVAVLWCRQCRAFVWLHLWSFLPHFTSVLPVNVNALVFLDVTSECICIKIHLEYLIQTKGNDTFDDGWVTSCSINGNGLWMIEMWKYLQ